MRPKDSAKILPAFAAKQRAFMEANLAKAPTNAPAPINRSSAGLRDAIFDEIDAIRDGTGNPTRANAVAKLAATVVETVRMELEVQKYANASASQTKITEHINGLPKPLELGATA